MFLDLQWGLMISEFVVMEVGLLSKVEVEVDVANLANFESYFDQTRQHYFDLSFAFCFRCSKFFRVVNFRSL